jgi:hypothetical protein
LDSVESVIVNDVVCACFGGDACTFSFGEYKHSHDIPQGVRQRHDFSELLVGVARIGVGRNVYLNALVELGGGGFARELEGFVDVKGILWTRGDDLTVAFAVFLGWHGVVASDLIQGVGVTLN